MRAPGHGLLLVTLLLVALVPTVAVAVPDDAPLAPPLDLTDELQQARDRLAELDATVSLAVEEFNAATVHLERLQAQQAETAARVDALTAEVTGLEATTTAFVRSMYMHGSTSGLASVLQSDGVTEAGRGLAVMQRLTRQRQAQVELLGARRQELAAAEHQLAVQVAEAERRQEATAARRDDVEDLIAAQRDEVDDLRSRIAEAERQAQRAAERQAREAAERAAQAAAREAAQEATPAPTTPAPGTDPPPQPDPAPPGTRKSADTAVQAALSQVGKPYEYAADGPDSYDCSGLTKWAWARAGVALTHYSRAQYEETTRITRVQLQPGDLVFYGSPIHHVAMYVDGTSVVEAPYTGANVRVREDGLLRSDIVGYGRV